MPKASCQPPMRCCIPGCRRNCNGNSINWTGATAGARVPLALVWSLSAPARSALRMILIWDNLKGHLSYHMVRWLLQRGILPLYTPISGSWLNMAESLQRIIVRRALSGQHPQSAQQLIDWLEQTVTGWNKHPTPFVWNGKRRRRRERARLQRLGGSGAAVLHGYSIAN